MMTAKEYYDDMNELCIVPREYDNTVIPLMDHYGELKVHEFQNQILNEIDEKILFNETRELIKIIIRKYIVS